MAPSHETVSGSTGAAAGSRTAKHQRHVRCCVGGENPGENDPVERSDNLDPSAEGDDDDEALRWAGDEERGRDAPNLRGSEPSAEVLVDDEEPPAPGARGRTAATVSFALPYLLYAVGWIFAVQNLSSGSMSLASEVLWQFGEFLTILAVPLWFATVLTLTRDNPPLVRVGWLSLGLGVLIPWPFVLDLYAALEIAGSVS